MVEKLVRDRIPDLGGWAGHYPLFELEELLPHLIAKLREETEELIEKLEAKLPDIAPDTAMVEHLRDQAIWEIADVEDVLERIAMLLQISPAGIENARFVKRCAKGKFDMGYVLNIPDEEEDRSGRAPAQTD